MSSDKTLLLLLLLIFFLRLDGLHSRTQLSEYHEALNLYSTRYTVILEGDFNRIENSCLLLSGIRYAPQLRGKFMRYNSNLTAFRGAIHYYRFASFFYLLSPDFAFYTILTIHELRWATHRHPAVLSATHWHPAVQSPTQRYSSVQSATHTHTHTHIQIQYYKMH